MSDAGGETVYSTRIAWRLAATSFLVAVLISLIMRAMRAFHYLPVRDDLSFTSLLVIFASSMILPLLACMILPFVYAAFARVSERGPIFTRFDGSHAFRWDEVSVLFDGNGIARCVLTRIGTFEVYPGSFPMKARDLWRPEVLRERGAALYFHLSVGNAFRATGPVRLGMGFVIRPQGQVNRGSTSEPDEPGSLPDGATAGRLQGASHIPGLRGLPRARVYGLVETTLCMAPFVSFLLYKMIGGSLRNPLFGLVGTILVGLGARELVRGLCLTVHEDGFRMRWSRTLHPWSSVQCWSLAGAELQLYSKHGRIRVPLIMRWNPQRTLELITRHVDDACAASITARLEQIERSSR